MRATSRASGDDPQALLSAVAGQRTALFAVCWGAAALFHLAGNPRPGFLAFSALFTTVQLAVGVAAGAVLLRPGSSRRLVVLCSLIPISAWLEAPFVGNHWVLAAAISLAYLTAAAWAASRSRAGAPADNRAAVWTAFTPTARLTLLVAYGFAAFAKLNASFFDPAVSCAVFYQDQLVRSWGLAFLSAAGRPMLGTATAVGAAAIELSVPVLLAMRRTRRVGVLLAFAFHWVLGLDLAQHFWDFSAVLVAGFLLFVDDDQLHRLAELVSKGRSQVRPAAARGAALVAALGILVVLAATAVPHSAVARGAAVLTGHAAWMLLGTGGLVLVAVSRRAGGGPRPGTLRIPSPVLLVVPALVLLNGLTPYLELKTGFGWNMYGNLRTVAGESNHFLVPRTVDLTGLQSDQVEILESSDPALSRLVGTDYALAYSEFREYAHTHPDTAVTYRRGDTVRHADPIGSDEAGRGGVSLIARRLQSFRVIDTSPVERCQPVFTPAR